jgi:hypothetical protein
MQRQSSKIVFERWSEIIDGVTGNETLRINRAKIWGVGCKKVRSPSVRNKVMSFA